MCLPRAGFVKKSNKDKELWSVYLPCAGFVKKSNKDKEL